jgi:polyhydroxyalkanoate synthesis repressor PhaR
MPVIIKRYANRKLYNTNTRSYVTLEEIGWMIQEGQDVTILDHESGNDITAVTLTQVVFDQEKRSGGLVPQAFFSRLIKARDGGLAALRHGIDSFIDPDGHFTAEIQRRLNILQDEEQITPEEYQRMYDLLLDDRFDALEQTDEEKASSEQIKALMAQLEALENEINHIKQKKQAG